MKGPRIIVDFSDELARKLSGENVDGIITKFLASESCIDITAASNLLGLSVSETRKHAQKWPVINLGERSHRYRISDILNYRNKLTAFPKTSK